MCAGGEEIEYEYNSHGVGYAQEWEFALVEGSQMHGGFTAACPPFHLHIPEYIF